MDTKLTLRLNKNVIERAKKYASQKEQSLSRLVENYLNSITSESENDIEISPFVKSIASGKSMPDKDWKELRDDYLNHQENKYL